MKSRIVALLAALHAGLAMLVPAPACAQSMPQAARLATQARSHLAAQNPRAALALIDTLDKSRGAEPASFDLLFLQGVAWQELAAQAVAGEREQALRNSRDAYEKALQLRPTSAALFNNLGSLAAASGDDAAARGWYEKAVAAGDARRGYYALNYARFLESRDRAEAVKYARIALDAAPDSAEAREYLGKLYGGSRDDDSIVRYLARNVREGHTKLALSMALQELAGADARPPAQRAALLAIVADALAHDRALLAQQPAAEVVERLRGLASDVQIGDGGRQLVRVLADPPASAGELSWWNDERVQALERSRRGVMRELLRGLGEQQLRSRPALAERWLRLAIESGDHGPDPDAFLRLVELYAASERGEAVAELMRRYEWDLFSEKSAAYGRGDWEQIYRLHLALGMTYAQMKVWRSSSPFQNAVFQLENAAKAAQQFNRSPQRQGRPELVLPPAAVLKLSEGYTALGQKDRSTELRVRSADDLQRAQRPADSAQVLRTVRPDEARRLDPANAATYGRLQSQVPAAAAPAPGKP